MPDVYKQSFKQNYTNNIELSIFNCGLERCAPGQTWGPGIRDHYLIHLVVSGKGIFEVGGRTWEVSGGDLFFARPSQLIRYTADEQQPWEYSWVGFNGACAHKLAAQLPFTDDAPVHHTSDPDGMRAALTNIYSSRGLQPQDEATMVGYLLKNTVTKYGTVSRGVCRAQDGYLADIHETLKIQLREDGTIFDEDSGALLEPDTVVSMNFWGFMPSIFDELARYFETFLRRDARENVKAECLLPNMVGALLREGRLSVSVLQSKDRWFGMTYHEDRARVASELQTLHEAGVYPEKLR